jgi:hypothetical protein
MSEGMWITKTTIIQGQPRAERQSGWPDGTYVLDVVGVGEYRPTQAGNRACRVDLTIVGTNKTIFWFMSDAVGANWAWRDVVEAWDQLDKLMGRRFVTLCRNEQFKNKWYLRPIQFIAEVVQ